MTRTLAVALAVASLVACGDGSPPPAASNQGALPPETDGNFVARTYERSFVFASQDGDSLFLVPWFMETLQTPDTVERHATAWLARGGVWEQFFSDAWGAPPTRAPSRVLPHGSMNILVREGDHIDGIIFDEGPRSLELVLGDVTASWVGSHGEAIEVLDGAAYLSDRRVDGAVLDLARASGDGQTPGDWAFLLSGDSARFVFAAGTEHGGEEPPAYRGWADIDGESLQWPQVAVDWRETQAFPPARRDVPVAWRIWSADDMIEGQLEAASADIRPGTGPGPLLPVRALFEVRGEISTVRGRFQVHGLLVHERR